MKLKYVFCFIPILNVIPMLLHAIASIKYQVSTLKAGIPALIGACTFILLILGYNLVVLPTGDALLIRVFFDVSLYLLFTVMSLASAISHSKMR